VQSSRPVIVSYLIGTTETFPTGKGNWIMNIITYPYLPCVSNFDKKDISIKAIIQITHQPNFSKR
jgi:hypothetical protein